MAPTPPAPAVNPTQAPPPGAPPASNQLANASGTGAGAAASGSAFGPGGGGLPLAPGAAASPYEFQAQLTGTYVVVGQVIAGLLGTGIPANQPVQASKIITAFEDASQNTQIAVEDLLVKAGFYVDPSTGQTLSQAPALGTSDSSNLNALSLALLNTYNANTTGSPAGTSLSSLVQSNIFSGAGQVQRQTSPSPVLGGGQAYQNLVTAPADLYNSLYSTFENTLGRAPQQSELDNFVKTFQQMQFNYQQALNVQQEQVSSAKYNQQVTARNTELGYETTPRVAAGAVPQGPFHTPAAWATAFLQYASDASGGGANLATHSNIAFVLAWMAKEGTWSQAQGSFNPLGATLPGPGESTTVSPSGPNPQGAQKYTNWAQGMQQTLNQLASSGTLYQLLESGNASNPPKAGTTQIVDDLRSWSNGKIKSLPLPSRADNAAAGNASAAVSKTIAQGRAYTGYQQQLAAGPGPAGFQGPPGLKAGAMQPASPPTATPGGGPGPMGVQGPGPGQSATPGAPPTTQPQQSTTPVATPPNPTAPNATTTTTAPQGPGQPATTPTATPPNPAQQGQQPRLSVPNPDNNPKGKGKGAPPTPRPAPPVGQLPQGAPATVQPPTPLPTIPPYDVTGQNQFSTGDTYIEPSTLYGTSPPSMQGAAFQQATTGDNAVPYEVYNYLQAFDTVANMISSGKVNG